MELIQTVLSFVVALGVLVTIHEYGHFWVARKCGVKVLRFSVGFGHPLFKWQDKQGTEFWISSIPLGGYVKMLDAREGEIPEALKDQEFTQKPVLQRIAVFAAGPAVNLFFAVFVYWFLFIYGVTQLAPIVGDIDPLTSAGQAGVQRGDEIVAVDGRKVSGWESVNYALIERIGDTGVIELSVKPEASELVKTRVLSINRFLGDKEITSPLDELGLTLYQPRVPPIISEVVAGGAAERDGLLAGDQIITANDAPIANWEDWVNVIRDHPEKPIQVELDRSSERLWLELTPQATQTDSGQSIGYIGAKSQQVSYPEGMYRQVSYSMTESMVKAVDKTLQLIVISFKSIGKMLVGIVSVENLSGPIQIAQIAGDTASYGVEPFLSFLAYLSISLGVLNLLPIPVLDGGHILYACIELVTGKPLSPRLQHAGLALGLSILLMFMVIAFYNDIARLVQ